MRIDDPGDGADAAPTPSPWSRDGSSVWDGWSDDESRVGSDSESPVPSAQPSQVQSTQLPPPDVASAVPLPRSDPPAPESSNSGPSRRNKWLPWVAVFALGVLSGGVVKLVANQSDPAASSVDAQDTDQAGSARDLSGGTIDELSSAAVSNGDTSASPTEGATDRPPLPEGAQYLGDPFADSAYVGDYGVLNPTLLPEIKGTAPTTATNVDRWLDEARSAGRHLAVRSEANADGDTPTVSWQGPITKQPTWLLERGGSTDRFERHFDDFVQVARRTADGTWVEVSVNEDLMSEVAEWIDGLSSVATVADVTAPPGYAEIPEPSASIQLDYAVTSQNTTITLTTFQFEIDLDESRARAFVSEYGDLGPPVADFQGGGTLYPLIQPDELSVEDAEWAWLYGWVVNPHLLVVVGTAPALTPSDRDRVAQALSVASELDGQDGRPKAVPPKALSHTLQDEIYDDDRAVGDDTAVFNVRYGDLGPERFVYVERPVRNTDPTGLRCRTLVFSGLFSSSGCTRIDKTHSNADGAVCAYRIEPAMPDGSRFYLLVDNSIADQVDVSVEGVPVDEAEMSIVSGTTDGEAWTVKSAWLSEAPDVSAGDLNCQQL